MNEKVNILMCCSDLTVKGGMVTVIKNFLEYDNWEEFNIIYIPTHIEKNKLLLTLFFVKAYIKIIIFAIQKKIDIAYLHTAERGSVYRKGIILRTLKKFGIKTILHHHGAEFEKFYDSLPKLQKEYVNKTLALADINIVLSESLIPMIKNKSKDSNIEVLYNSVAVTKNQYNPDGNYILFLGRLGERKGIYDLLKAILKIDNEIDHRFKFLLCGDGDINTVKSRVASLELEHRIAHIGWIDSNQKKEFYKNVILNVLPSYHEGLPMTILETMSYGIPNISTNIASIPEVIISNKNGFLIDPGDVEMLASKIKEIVSKRELRTFLSKNAYSTIKEEFSIDNNMKKLKGILRNLKTGEN